MSRAFSGLPTSINASLNASIDRLLPTFPGLLRTSISAIESDLHNRLVPDITLPAELPGAFAFALAAAIAHERTLPDDKSALLLRHYFDFMPRLRHEQLATRTEPQRTLFHTPLRLAELPCLRAALTRLFNLINEAGATPQSIFGAPDPESLFARHPTLFSLYTGSYYGGFMPLLYAYPADLAAIAPLLGAGTPLHHIIHHIIDTRLAAPIIHELSHLHRSRAALFPPYLDECIAGWLGVRAMPRFAYPEVPDDNAIYAAPWLAQTGQALARAIGPDKLIAAHAGLLDWPTALGSSLYHCLVRLGWSDHVTHRNPHFLSSHHRPEPWMKSFFLARAGLPLDHHTFETLDALSFHDIDPGPETPFDTEILTDALRAMCLLNTQSQGTFRVAPRLPETIHIDLLNCRVTTSLAPQSVDPIPPSYLFPPALAARLRKQANHMTVKLHTLCGLPALTEAILAGATPQSTSAFTVALTVDLTVDDRKPRQP